MEGIGLKVVVSINSAIGLFGRLRKAGDVSLLLAKAEELAKYQVNTDFNTETSPKNSQRWAPNHPLYKKLCKPASAKILQKTGALRRSIKFNKSGQSLIKSTNLRYARVHQYGATLRNVKIKKINKGYLFFKSLAIPARPFIEYHPQMIDAFVSYINRKLTSVR